MSLILFLAALAHSPSLLRTDVDDPQSTRSACAAVAPASHLSPAAQAYLSGGEHRLIADTPSSKQEWLDLQARSVAAGEAWLAEEIAAGGIAIARSLADGVALLRVDPIEIDEDAPLIFNLHGGGFALNGGDASLYSAVAFAKIAGLPSVSVDYRMTPEHAYPAALEDAVRAYAQLIHQDEERPIVVYGLSAGGGLAAAFLLKVNELGLPMPVAAVLNSPWVDLSLGGDSYALNDCHDPLIGQSGATLEELAAMYIGDRDASDPFISPVAGDWRGIDLPVLLLAGTRDLLLSDTVRLHRAMWDAGMDADLIVYDGLWHAFSVEPEFETMIEHVDGFFRRRAR